MSAVLAYAKKLFYKINEVSEIVGVEAYVLRYWETKFPSLKPDRLSNEERRYRAKDIELLLRIRTLLYDEKFTIAGAVDRIKKDPKGSLVTHDDAPAEAHSTAHLGDRELQVDFEAGEEFEAKAAFPVEVVRAKLSSLRGELVALRDAIPVRTV